MDSELSIGRLIRFSWSKTKEILFPFQLKRWFKILFIVWLAGHAGGWGGGYNFPRPKLPIEQSKTQPQDQIDLKSISQEPQKLQEVQEPTQTQATLGHTRGILQKEVQKTNARRQANEKLKKALQKIPLPIWAILFLIIIGVGLLFSWLSARFNFIFLDTLLRRDTRIGESFRTHKLLGNSFFLWLLGVIAPVIMIFSVLALVVGWSAAFAKPLLWFLIPVFFLILLGFSVLMVFVADFVSPVMYRDGIKTMEALKRFISFKPQVGQLALYLLIKILLGIAAGIIGLLLALVVGVIVLITSLVVVAIGALVVSIFPFLKPVLLGLGVLGIVIAFLVFLIVSLLVTLPLPIFFGVFALSYLPRFNLEYNLFGHPLSGSSSP